MAAIGGVSGGPPALATFWVRTGVDAGVGRLVHGRTAAIGSDPRNAVAIHGRNVAPYHAGVTLRGGVWVLEPTGADQHNLWIDGNPVHGMAVLAPGSAVRVGEVTLAFEPDDRWEDSGVPAASAAPATAMSDAALERSRIFWGGLAAAILLVIAFFLLRGR